MWWIQVQKILDKKHWSLKKLSQNSGVKYETLKKYKYGKRNPSFENVCKIVGALNINLNIFQDKKSK